MKKTPKNYHQKTTNDPDFSEEGTEQMSVGHVGVFCQNLGITAYTLENYSNFKNKFLFNNSSILELNINDYYNSNKKKGKVSFTELSEIINTLSSQDFAGMDKFRLRERLGKIKGMCDVKMNKTKKSKRSDSCMSDILSSPFSLVMTDLGAGSRAGESAPLTLDKKVDSLESKFLTASSEKISCLQKTVSLLN